METQGEPAYTIGALAALTGLPVKTIRFYSDEGVLPPAGRTAAGYRLYAEADRARLELIRTLRDVGVDLPTVRAVLDRDLAAVDALDLQLRAVEGQLRTLRAARLVLRRARAGGGGDVGYLRRLHNLARLNAVERARLLRDVWTDAAAGSTVDEDWLRTMQEASVADLPDDPTDAQLEAWLELAELSTDEGFRANLRRQAAGWSTWSGAVGDLAGWRALDAEVVAAADAALRDGTAPDAAAARPLAQRYLVGIAALLDRQPDAAMRRELLAPYAEHDPRSERWWGLVAVLQGLPGWSSSAGAYRWLGAACQAHLAAV